ncbi:hypothetical protein HY772_09100 [Candidatus Woesearchaeota archaeon]|nr:hypothetical protein [Candidatus Woesearchaeota archaeon]
MKTITSNWRYLLVGLYTWIVTIFFGAILLDVVYAKIAVSVLKPSETATLFSKAADFLLLIGALTILAALGAIGSSWRLGSARNPFIASLVVVALEFLTPMLFFPLLQQIQINLGLNVSPWIRLSASALSSILAFVGLWNLASLTS